MCVFLCLIIEILGDGYWPSRMDSAGATSEMRLSYEQAVTTDVAITTACLLDCFLVGWEIRAQIVELVGGRWQMLQGGGRGARTHWVILSGFGPHFVYVVGLGIGYAQGVISVYLGAAAKYDNCYLKFLSGSSQIPQNDVWHIQNHGVHYATPEGNLRENRFAHLLSVCVSQVLREPGWNINSLYMKETLIQWGNLLAMRHSIWSPYCPKTIVIKPLRYTYHSSHTTLWGTPQWCLWMKKKGKYSSSSSFPKKLACQEKMIPWQKVVVDTCAGCNAILLAWTYIYYH